MRGRSKSMYASSNKLANFASDSSDDDVYRPKDKLANFESDSSDDDLYQTEGDTSLSTENNVNLIRKVWEQIPKIDNLPFDRRIEQINWNRIADDTCTPRKAKLQFENVIAPERKYRILSEILKDLEKRILCEVNLPKKPLPAFSIFAEENRNLIKTKIGPNSTRGSFSKVASEEFKHLSEQEKESYRQKSKQMKKEYKDVVAKFNLEDKFTKKSKLSKTGTDNPATYYHNQLKSQGSNISFQEARRLFTDLSKKEKLSLILKYLGVKQGEKLNLEQYKKAKKVLSKEDMAMIDDYEGRPKMMSAYNAFMKDFLASNRTSTELQWSELFKAGVEQWKQLPAEKKYRYENASAKRKIKFKEEYDEYIASLPPDRQEYETTENKGKHKKVKEDSLRSEVNNSLNYSDAAPKKRKSKKSITGNENGKSQQSVSLDKLKSKERKEKSLNGKDETDTYVPEEFSPKKKKRKLWNKFAEDDHNLNNEISQEKVGSSNRFIEEIKEKPQNQKKIKLSKYFAHDELNSSSETSPEKSKSKNNRFIKEIKQEQEKRAKLQISINFAEHAHNSCDDTSEKRLESRNSNFVEEIDQKPQKKKKLKISKNFSGDEQYMGHETFQEKVVSRNSRFVEEITEQPQKQKKLKVSTSFSEDEQNLSKKIFQEKIDSINNRFIEEIKQEPQKQKKLKISKNVSEDEQNLSNETSQEKLDSRNSKFVEEIKEQPQKQKKLKVWENFSEDEQNLSNEIFQEKIDSINNRFIEEINQEPLKQKKVKISKSFAEDEQNSSNETTEEKLETRNSNFAEEIKLKSQKKRKLKNSKNFSDQQNLSNESSQEKVKSRNSTFIEEVNQDQEIFPKIVRDCPKKPPSSLRQFYAFEIFKGPSSQGKVYFDALSRKEKKALKAKHDRAKSMHLQELQTFIKSLSKKEILYYQKHGFPSSQVNSDSSELDELDALNSSENSDDSDPSEDKIF